MVDIVDIGYKVRAEGLEKANRDLNALLDKADKINSTTININANGKGGTNGGNNSPSKEIDRTTKAMEKQRLVGELLAQGLDKSTATTIANFKLLGASVEQTTQHQKQLEHNTAYVTQRKELEKLTKQQTLHNQQVQRSIDIAQKVGSYKQEGFTTTSANKLATLEMSGANSDQVNAYKQALIGAQGGLQQFGVVSENTAKKVGILNTEIAGIAKYAVLSAVIYGLMTATTRLAVATVQLADEYTAIQNRMKLYIKDAKELEKVNANLVDMSMVNNVGLKETATLYARLAPSLQKLGANTATITTVVDAFGKAMRIGGATAMEASSATIQFSQAMASGKLAGDEFRSISEASPRFLKAIAEGSGIATESLKKLSSEGFLTTAVVAKALLKESPKLIAENKLLGVTMEQGANAVKTAFTSAIGEFNAGAKITETLGNSMMDIAVSLADFATTAKESGEAFKESFEKYLPVLNTVGNVIKAVAVVMISKYVASLVVAGATSAVTAIQTARLTLGVTASARAFNVASTSALVFGRALSSMMIPTNLATLALTVAGVASAYLLMRDNASEANQALVEQSKFVGITNEEFRKLNAERQKNVKSDLEDSLIEANKNVVASYEDVLDVLKKYRSQQAVRPDIDSKDVSKVIDGLEKGTLSFETAQRKLKEMGVPSSVLKGFKDATVIYDESAKSAGQLAESAEVAGSKIKVAGNEAQNASIGLKKAKDEMKSLGEATLITANQIEAIGKGFKNSIKELQIQNKVASTYGLDADLAKRLVEESQNVVKSQEEILLVKKKLNEAEEQRVLALGKDATVEQIEKIKKHYDSLREKMVTPLEDKLLQVTIARNARNAQALQAVNDAEKKRLELMKEQEKQWDKMASFDDTINSAERLNELLEKGASYEVAKVASQKEYYEVFGNTAKAIQIVEAQQRLAQLEYLGSLEKANDMNGRTLAWIREGLSLEQARAMAGAYYMTETHGREMAERSILNTLNAQRTELFGSNEELEVLNQYMEAGISLTNAQYLIQTNRLELLGKERGLIEGATQELADGIRDERDRNDILKATNESLARGQELERQKQIYIEAQNTAYDKLIVKMAIANKMASNPNLTEAKAEKEVKKDTELNAQRDLLSIRAQIAQNLNTQSKLIKDIESQYPLLKQGEVKRLAVAKQMLNISERIAEEQERQAKSPIGDFSGIDFDVFGSFGNPFQEALDGLNEFTAKSLESASVLKALDEQINAEKAKGIESEILKNLELEKSAVIIQQEVDRKKALNASVTKGLALAKTAFKEDSKGYKTITALERTYQAIQIAHSLWKKKDQLAETARELMGYAKTAIAYVSSTATKIASEGALNTVKGVGAVIQQGTGGDVYSAIPRMLAMAGVIAGLGVAISGGFGSSESGSIAPSNDGTGTVFGDPTAMSKSISKSIDILADNSDLMLPINNSMLASLRNIESALGGVANLIIRREYGADIASQYGFDAQLTGTIGKLHDFASKATLLFTGFTDKLTGFGVGGMLNDLVGSVLGGLFGKTSQEVTGSGITGWAQTLGDILKNGFALNSYADIKTTKKSLFSKKTSYSTQYGKVDGEIKNQFQLIFSNVYDSILSASSVLDRDMDEVAKKLNASIINIGKIATSGLSGEDIQEKLEAVIGQQSDNLAKKAVGGLDAFQKVGEGYYETLVRVSSGIEQADYYLDRLGYTAIKYTDILYQQGDVAVELIRQSVLLNEHTKDINGAFYDLVNTFDGSAEELHSFIVELRDLQEQLEMTGKNADYLTSSMILGAGSLNALQQGFDAYYDMLSPAEQASELTRRLTKDFEFLSLQLPDDVKAFRDLVNSIDVTTESGQKLYGQVIALAPEFNELQDALESANSETNKLVESLRNLADEAKKARGETDQNTNLEATRYEFEQTSVLAMQGDQDAINKLLDLGKNLMSLSKTYSVTSAEYARDLALIQRVATVSADNLESGLGISSNNNLSLSDTTNTTPKLETSSSSTDSKIDAMNENLNSAMIAVAKNTQQMATLLDRWDYGDRLNVHIEQDDINDRVPVKSN